MPAEIKVKDGLFSIYDEINSTPLIANASVWVAFKTEEGSQKQVTLYSEDNVAGEQTFADVHGQGKIYNFSYFNVTDGVEITLCIKAFEQRSFVLVQVMLKNLTMNPIFLDQFCLCQVDRKEGGRFLFNNSSENLKFFKVGWHGWAYTGLRIAKEINSSRLADLLGGMSYSNPSTPRPHTPAEFWSEGWGMLIGDVSALVAGFATTASQFGQVYACIRPGEEVFKLITQMDGVRLDPGESRLSEWGFLQRVNLPHPEPAGEYFDAVSKEMQARVPDYMPPPMWTHWYHFFHDITEALFIQNLEVLAEIKDEVPFAIAELDDGYQLTWGDWTETNKKFPGGLEKLAAGVTAKGFSPGLWLAPFAVQASSHIAKEHDVWLVKSKSGKPMRAGFVYNMFLFALDTSHPAVLEHVRTLIKKISCQWGFKMLKVDFINIAALPGKRYDPKLTRAECLRKGIEAIRLGAGEDAFVLASGCPFGPAIGMVDAMRIGPDTAPQWEPYFNWLPWAGPFIRREPSPPSQRNALRHTLNLSGLNRRWWINDPDCLLVRDVDTRLTEAEVESALTAVGLSGGLLVVSDDMRLMNQERLGKLSKLVPNLGLCGESMDLLERGMPEIFRVKMHQVYGDWQLVGLFNWSRQGEDRVLNLKELGFPVGTPLDVFDFWQGFLSKISDEKITFEEIPSHGCKLIRICENRNEPHIVGSTLHISQGGEIEICKATDGRLMIDTIDFGRKVRGELWFSFPTEPSGASCNGEVIDVIGCGEGIYLLRLDFMNKARIILDLDREIG